MEQTMVDETETTQTVATSPKVRPKAGPTRVYAYGAKAPIENAPVVREQMRLMHKYRNRLVELELARRAAVEQVILTHNPTLVEIERQIAKNDKEIEDIRTNKRKQNSEARSKEGDLTEIKKKIGEIKAILKLLYANRKELRKIAFADPGVRVHLDAIESNHKVISKTARAASGLYWANYGIIENSCKSIRVGPPPRFHRWDGNCKIAVQLQNGLSLADARNGTNRCLSLEGIDPHPRRVGWNIAKLRVGSVGTNRGPLWASFPTKLHRLPPEDGEIKWAIVTVRRVGNHEKWRLLLTIERDAGWDRPDAATEGSVGIDLGWRVVPGGLRVAYWVGSDGQKGEVILPDKLVERWAIANQIRSERDLQFNTARDALADQLDKISPLPEWLAEKAATIRSWRSPGRLAGLFWQWEKQSEGETEALTAARVQLGNWRKLDARQWDVEASVRLGAQNARLSLFREYAAMLRRQYAVAIVENINWASMQALPKTEVDDGSQDASRTYQRIASVGLLADSIKKSMLVRKGKAEFTTQKCSNCGNIEAFDAASNLNVVCSKCHHLEDQDERAAKNLLASESVLSEA